jgi:hypothetical protein
VVGLLLLALFLALRFPDAFGLPFLNDDYVFLDHVAGKGFLSLWPPHDLVFHWWRPWSREFHYWWLQRAFGPVEWPFHVASGALVLAVIAAYWSLARRLAGAPAAAVAVAGALTLPGWGLMLLWPAGAQDLWMMLWALLSLHAWRNGRHTLAALLFALALLSKETVATLPLVFLAFERWVMRRPWPRVLARLAPTMGVTLVWAIAHPLVLGRLWAPGEATTVAPSPAAAAPGVMAWRSLLAVFSLDRWPAPDSMGLWPWVGAALCALVLALFVVVFARPDARSSSVLGADDATRLPSIVPLSMVWWFAGTLPLLLPGLGWHAYYAHFAALGAWVGIGRLCMDRPRIALLPVVLLTLLGAARALTPSEDWGEASYLRRAGAHVSGIRARLTQLHPSFEPHARLWFVRLPDRIGFLNGDGPAVRVWYRDRTLSAGFYSDYRPRAADAPAGPEHFFRMDESGVLSEVASASDTVGTAPADNPRWHRDQAALAAAFARGGDWRRAAKEFRRLAIAFPDSAGYALNAAAAYNEAGDSAAARQWLREAARRPGAPPEVVRAFGAASRAPAQAPARRRQPRGTGGR